jgi:HSP20 family molecular chaperone IbpA
MFNKKNCRNCGEKIKGDFIFCPFCGSSTGKELREEDWGLLGKNDEMQEMNTLSRGLFAGMSDKMLNKMLSSAMKMLEKEMQKGMSSQNTELQSNIELYINGKKISPENIKVTKKVEKQPKSPIIQTFNQENIKKFSTLPKKEPTTNIRRLSNKVVYEIDIPGVTSIKDIAVSKLENSIEIKAVAKDKAYAKVIPIDLPLRGFKLDKDKLILELGIKS